MGELNWKPISQAPMDGRPLWTRGNNYGDASKGQHFGWAFWDGSKWVADGVDGAILLYLTHYMEIPPMNTDKLMELERRWREDGKRLFDDPSSETLNELGRGLLHCADELSALRAQHPGGGEACKSEPRWTMDCQGKQDYDGAIASVSTRYWPANYRQDNLHSAASAVVVAGVDIVTSGFAAETEAQVKEQVVEWVRSQQNRIAAALRAEQAVGEEQRARELLADEFERDGFNGSAAGIRSMDSCGNYTEQAAIRAIRRALGTARQPENLGEFVIALLIAGGHVTQAKVDEARKIALSHGPYEMPARQSEGKKQDCEDCYGAGVVHMRDCPTCGGSGYCKNPASESAEAKLAAVLAFLGSDATAISYQSLGQYRKAAMLAAAPGGEGEGK